MKRFLIAAAAVLVFLFSFSSWVAVSAEEITPDILYTAEKALPADLGNFNDYGGGGGDYGGGDYGGDYGGNYDYGGGYYADSDSSSGDASTLDYIIGIAIFIAIFALVNFINKKKNAGRAPLKGALDMISKPIDHTERITVAICENDPEFDAQRFVEWSKEVFVRLQRAWSERDTEQLRPLEREELFAQHKAQIEEYVRLGRINRIDRICVKTAFLNQYRRNPRHEYLRVYAEVRMTDYIEEEKTGKILKGNPDVDCFMNYLLTFIRTNGVKTKKEGDGISVFNCPNCGAPVSVTSAGRCEYCDSVISTGNFDWVLTSMETVKSNTPVDPTPVIIEQ